MMRRSPMKPSTKPMSRGKPMKSRPKKRAKVNGIDYLALCRGQPCFLLLPMVRFHDQETVVPCHSNQGKHGKGMGLKASDEFTVPGCMNCHYTLDQGSILSKEQRREAWDQAFQRWSKYRMENYGV